ncbi:hypothetical protein LRS06_17445 [Hymenobacter sp. J193]|uniref:hypothetical protein n=1 Tax=Hymenobacter sp. J193 TaxID=2898429 RepID=UPI002150FF82|nr:hypothetical protein [Hymenobacter sp. J193]MCR5889522.1 hypothetical protein [Hymenobacter sp. J193]
MSHVMVGHDFHPETLASRSGIVAFSDMLHGLGAGWVTTFDFSDACEVRYALLRA